MPRVTDDNVVYLAHDGAKNKVTLRRLRIRLSQKHTILAYLASTRIPQSDNLLRHGRTSISSGSLWVEMEYLPWSLGGMIRASTGVDAESHIAYVVARMLAGMKFLHDMAIMHRNIMSISVRLGTQGEVKLGTSLCSPS
jgi:serine/threonine protein kinase